MRKRDSIEPVSIWLQFGFMFLLLAPLAFLFALWDIFTASDPIQNLKLAGGFFVIGFIAWQIGLRETPQEQDDEESLK